MGLSRKKTEEQRANQSAKMKAYWNAMNEVTYNKICELHRNRERSIESRKKQSEAMKALWAEIPKE